MCLSMSQQRLVIHYCGEHHVVPLGDVRPHTVPMCWCRPHATPTMRGWMFGHRRVRRGSAHR
jgi:hypothetical protein